MSARLWDDVGNRRHSPFAYFTASLGLRFPRTIAEAEAALREANRKFERRFRQIEKAPGFTDMSLDEMEELWTAAKKAQADSVA